MGNEHSPTYHVTPTEFPSLVGKSPVDLLRSGRLSGHLHYHGSDLKCRHCAASPWPVATEFHAACLTLLLSEGCHRMSQAAVLDRLWTSSTWRLPWRGAPVSTSHLIDRPQMSPTALRILETKCGISLRRLPAEVVWMVHAHSADCEIWRIGSAMDFTLRLCKDQSMASARLYSFPLGDILSWERGGPPMLATGASVITDQSVIRLTVDQHGIRQIERLPTRPRWKSGYVWRTSQPVYVVEEDRKLVGVVAKIKVRWMISTKLWTWVLTECSSTAASV